MFAVARWIGRDARLPALGRGIVTDDPTAHWIAPVPGAPVSRTCDAMWHGLMPSREARLTLDVSVPECDNPRSMYPVRSVTDRGLPRV